MASIVVFCPTLTSPYYVLLLQGIEAVANKQGYGVFICNTQRDPRLEEKYLRMMGTIEPLGIIYCFSGKRNIIFLIQDHGNSCLGDSCPLCHVRRSCFLFRQSDASFSDDLLSEQ